MIRLSAILFFLLSGVILAQKQKDVKPIYQSFKKEPKSEFSFKKFERGFNVDSLNICFDSLKVKEQYLWDFNDSLTFAIQLLKADKHGSALNIFKNLNPKLIQNKQDFKYLITAYQLNDDLDNAASLIDLFKVKFKDDLDYISTQERFIDFKIYLKNNEINRKWVNANHILPLDFENDSIRDDPEVFERVLDVMYKYEKELHYQTNFIFDEDPIVAAIAFDLGVLLEKHFSYSEAYIAFSIARNFDKSNKEVLEHLKETRNYLNDNKYHLPIFRNYFPRKKKGRFELSSILERMEEKKKLEEQPEPLNEIQPKEKKEYEKVLENYDTNLIYLTILLVILFGILIFVRSGRKS